MILVGFQPSSKNASVQAIRRKDLENLKFKMQSAKPQCKMKNFSFLKNPQRLYAESDSTESE